MKEEMWQELSFRFIFWFAPGTQLATGALGYLPNDDILSY